MHERQEMHEEDEDNLQERHSADLQQAQQQPAGASIQSIATQAAAAMAAAMVAQQLLASAAATCGLDLASLSQFAIMAASQSSQQQQQAGAGAPQTPEQLMAAAVAAATFLSHTSQANQLAATASQLQAAGALNPLGQLNSNSSSNSNLNLSLAQAAAILPEDLTTLAEHQHALKLEQHGGGGGGGSANGAVGNANNNAPTLSHLHHQLNLGAAQQANSNQALGLNLVANNLHGHHAASSIGPIRGGARHQQHGAEQQQHHHHHQYQRHGSSSSSGGSSATSDTQTHNNSSSSLGAIANSNNSNNNNNAHNHHQSHHHQNQNHHHHNNNNNNNSHGHSHGHPHHQTTRHLLGHHHHSSIQTQQQLLATKGYNPLAVVVGSGQQTEILTPTHLRKAKLMFFYVRYPNSSTLKECFRDVRFNKNNTAQLVKWFSNFREFYYIQMEKFARDAIIDERIRCKEDIVVTYDHELINVLNNHYNKNRHIELPEVFRQVVEETLRHFFDAIHTKRDQEQSWKKAIYKVIARLDQEVPELFKTDAFNEHLE